MINIKITGTRGYIVESLLPYLKNEYGRDACIEAISVRSREYNFENTDVIIHAAGLIPSKAKSDSEYYDVNFGMTKEIALAAKRQGVKHFVYISSIAVLGASPVTKNIHLLKINADPATPYGESKLMAEQALCELSDDSFKVAILRVPDVYGGRNTDYLRRYENIADKYARLHINPMAYKNMKRSAVHIDNLCSAIAAAVRTEYRGTFIPCDKEPLSTFEYVKLIADIRGIKLLNSYVAGFCLRLVNVLTHKFEFFYGSFNAYDGAYIDYQALTAYEACVKSLTESTPDDKLDEC